MNINDNKHDHINHTSNDKIMCGLDLRNNLTADKNETGHYSTHLFTKQAESVIQTHNIEQVIF